MTRLTILAAFAMLIGWLIARRPRIEIRLERHGQHAHPAGDDSETPLAPDG